MYYKPPPATKTVIYRFNFALNWADAHAISHVRFYIDDVEVTYARHSRSAQYYEMLEPFEWVIPIGGSTNNNTGRQATWTNQKKLELKYRDYGTSDNMDIFGLRYQDGGDWPGYPINLPIITIIAIA
jgi:hypothetical protein